MAVSAMDVALWDLKAKHLGRPLIDLFGSVREALPVYGSGGLCSYTEPEFRQEFGRWYRLGIRRFKMKVGRDPTNDPARAGVARSVIGPASELFIDANSAYSRRQAASWGERFAKEFGAVWFEQPIAPTDLAGLRELRDRLPPAMEVADGEYSYDLDHFRRLLEAGAVDVVQADVTRCGGFTGFMKVATLCETWALPLSSHGAASLHVYPGCAVGPMRHAEYFTDHERIEHELFDDAPEPQGGVLRPDRSRHGHGLEFKWSEMLPKLFGPELIVAFEEFKSLWDPDWNMNPGKVVRPNPITSHLRLGSGCNPWRPETYFSYQDDQGDFSRAALRCVGVGECRRHEGGTMCPSYMATREEMHSTRGRTHLLFEMLQGDLVKDGFRNQHVKEALDLCLSCKGCKGDCPVHVDVATYKAEFLAHHYKGRLRPVNAYAFGLIARWARLASPFSRVANFLQAAPFFSDALKTVLGIARLRDIPAFARLTFKAWFFARPARNAGGPPVILWPDTFNNHYHPDVAIAATEFLERAGWRIIVPLAAFCCGRPLYDYGMLDTAKVWLKQILHELRDEIRAGIPMVGLEPSCVATFRDELCNLLPHDDDARRLSQQTLMLSEFIDRHMPDYPLPQLRRQAIVHGHCHHNAIMKMTAEEKVLKRMGLEYRLLDFGCCGMAGAFGFEKDHYDVSIACGERALLPAVREADADTLILANGFSCRKQIELTTERRALHLAHVLEMAECGADFTLELNGVAAEQLALPPPPRKPTKGEALVAIGIGFAVIGGLAWLLTAGTRRCRAVRR